MKPYIGKYAAGAQKAAEQRKTQKAFIKSLPLATRKTIIARDDALVAYNTAVANGSDRETILRIGQEYRSLRDQVAELIASR